MATVSQLWSAESTGPQVNGPYLTFGSNEVFVAAVAYYAPYSDSVIPNDSVASMGDVLDNPNFKVLTTRYNTGTSPYLWLQISYYVTNYPSIWVPGYPMIGTIDPSLGVSYPWAGLMWRIVPDPGKFIRPVKGTSLTGSGTSASYSDFGGTEKTNIIIGATSVGDDNYFVDSDTTDGAWSGVFTKFSTAAADIGISSQYKIVTGSAAQTYNGTFVGGTEFYTIGGAVFAETESPYWGIRAK